MLLVKGCRGLGSDRCGANVSILRSLRGNIRSLGLGDAVHSRALARLTAHLCQLNRANGDLWYQSIHVWEQTQRPQYPK